MTDLITCRVVGGLLHRGSTAHVAPGHVQIDRYGHKSPTSASRGLVVDVDAQAALMVLGEDTSHGGDLFDVPLAALAMDLTDETTRLHAAWWMRSQLSAHVRGHHGPTAFVYGVGGRKAWSLIGTRMFWSAGSPLVAHLDPGDNRRLPDGSRIVDALAQRDIIVHMIAQMEVNDG